MKVAEFKIVYHTKVKGLRRFSFGYWLIKIGARLARVDVDVRIEEVIG